MIGPEVTPTFGPHDDIHHSLKNDKKPKNFLDFEIQNEPGDSPQKCYKDNRVLFALAVAAFSLGMAIIIVVSLFPHHEMMLKQVHLTPEEVKELKDVTSQKFPNVEKSPRDSRSYSFTILDNGLQVLLISDPEANKAAASMDVHSGHFMDPDEVPGLAHFVEHMLFLGTEKYPDDDGFSRTLNNHGGSSNAYTSQENTNYYFDVQAQYLHLLLDMFAQFFSAPLFNPSATLREMKAVDAEHLKNVNDDHWREMQLLRSTSSILHPFHKFGTGSLRTLHEGLLLEGIDVREQLKLFYRKHYHATNMKLVVLGREPLATLEKMVRSSFVNVSTLAHDFSSPLQNNQPGYQHIRAYAHIRHVASMKEISLPPEAVISLSGLPGGSLELHTYDPKEKGKRRSGMPPLRTESQLGLRYCFEPTKASDTLSIKWLLPGVRHLFATKPLYYIASLLNSKGTGSLTALLRERELAHSIRAGVSESGEDFSWFEIRVEMTIFSQKLQQMRRNQRERAADAEGSEFPVDAQEDSVVKLVQQYIALVTAPKSGFEWRWAEMKAMADINFKFAEKTPAMEYVSGLSANMHHYPAEKVITAEQKFHGEVNIDLINAAASYLHPTRMLLFRMSSRCDPSAMKYREHWYQIPYSVTQISRFSPSLWKDIVKIADAAAAAKSPAAHKEQPTETPNGQKKPPSTAELEPEPPFLPGAQLPPKNTWMPDVADDKFFLSSSAPDRKSTSRSTNSSKKKIFSGTKAPVGANYPRLVHSSGGCELLWSMTDTQFKLPKIQFFIQLESNSWKMDNLASGWVAKLLYIEIVTQKLEHELSQAVMAGLMCVLEAIPSGFRLKIVGYNSKIVQFTSVVANKIFNLQVTHHDVKMAVEVVRLRLWGWKYGAKPLLHALDIADRVTQIPSFLPTELLSSLQQFCKMTTITKPKTKDPSTPNDNGETDAGSGNKDGDELGSENKDANKLGATHNSGNTFPQELPQIPVGKTVDEMRPHPLGDHQVHDLPGFLQLQSIPEAESQEDLQHLPDIDNLLDAFKRLKSDASRKQTHGTRESQRFRSKGTRHVSLAPFSESADTIPQDMSASKDKGSYRAEPPPTNNPSSSSDNPLLGQIKRSKLPPSTAVSMTAVRWLQETIPRLFTDVRMEAFVYGNLNSYTPQKLASVVSQAMPFRNDTLQRNVCPRSQARVRKLPTGKGSAIRMPELNPKERNSAYVATFQLGLRSINDDVLSSLLARILSEPFFHELRTKEQVGYLLHSARTTFHGTSSIILAVQSPRLSAAALDTRVEKFLHTFHEQLRTSTPAFLQAHINAEVSSLMAPWTHSEAEAANRWSEINSQQYVFDRRHKEVQALQRLTLGDLLQMYETKVVNWRGMHHRKLSVQMFGFAHEVPDYDDSLESFSPPSTSHNLLSTKQFGSARSLETLIQFCSHDLTSSELFPPMAHKNPTIAAKWGKKHSSDAKHQATNHAAPPTPAPSKPKPSTVESKPTGHT